ncbi:MAG TPA: cytochrome P450 [Acidimicrobiia bacterium]
MAAVLFDPTDQALRRDPYPTYRRMREEAPAWRSPDGIRYFTRYADCVELMRNPALSYDSTAARSYQTQLSDDPAERRRQLEETQKNRSLLDVDPPEHTRLRSLINRAFTPQGVEASRPVIVEYVDDLLDDIGGDRVDVVWAFGSLLPIMVICRMMGVPLDERGEFLAIGNAVGRSVDPDVPVEEKLAANARLREYIGGILDSRRSTPGDDLTTRLIAAAGEGRVSEDELVINTGVLLVAGFETTTNLITNAIYRFLEWPEQRALFMAHPETEHVGIEEVLRFDPPAQFMRARTIVEEVEIGGTQLRPGDPVIPLLAAANRDPEEFPDPDVLDVTRSVNRHLSFGVGHHLCVGAHLARMEARIAVRGLFERFPGLTLDPSARPQYRPNLQLRGFAELPVVLG